MLTPEKLNEIEKRCEAAEKGPWRALKDDDFDDRCGGIINSEREDIVTTDSGVYGPDLKTAEFIAASRTDIPLLIKEIRNQKDTIWAYNSSIIQLVKEFSDTKFSKEDLLHD